MNWSPAALAGAADDNLVIHATAATQYLPRARVRIGDGLVLVDSGLPCDTFNLICRARLSRVASAITDALAFFAETGHPYSWWVGPGSSPPDLPARLQAAGLVPAESEVAMTLDLAALEMPPTPSGLGVHRVRTPADLAQFATLTAANWSPPDKEVLRFYQLAEAALLRPDAAQWLYVGRLHGEPVATAELTVGGGVVGLYNISTHAAYRRRGIGATLTAMALADARRSGQTTAVLQATPAGVQLYERLGFRAFGEITEFQPGSRAV